MGVYIKGMEMPTEGEYNLTLYVCSDGSAYIDVALFPVDKDKFEAVPVPPHGRLIDADALVNKLVHSEFFSMSDYNNFVGLVLKAPTIVPVEEGE